MTYPVSVRHPRTSCLLNVEEFPKSSSWAGPNYADPVTRHPPSNATYRHPAAGEGGIGSLQSGPPNLGRHFVFLKAYPVRKREGVDLYSNSKREVWSGAFDGYVATSSVCLFLHTHRLPRPRQKDQTRSTRPCVQVWVGLFSAYADSLEYRKEGRYLPRGGCRLYIIRGGIMLDHHPSRLLSDHFSDYKRATRAISTPSRVWFHGASTTYVCRSHINAAYLGTYPKV